MKPCHKFSDGLISSVGLVEYKVNEMCMKIKIMKINKNKKVDGKQNPVYRLSQFREKWNKDERGQTDESGKRKCEGRKINKKTQNIHKHQTEKNKII